ncbi:hypothetical protein [Nocardia macrotermitis]|uniref:4Fe-4S Wbl-type domain-containing protein n=1 Tax=Nocardia macrotermitis TaxID=2585198 RepID=A0A7K0DDJ6_9NOCA|nr:hypothetical protein [Nocardia macrotermitis]MQY23875.1 hypothetical protein [Nocardia macrotermitis]
MTTFQNPVTTFQNPAPIAGSRRPSCADGPNDWDLDVGTPDSWRAAVRICQECPLLNDCAESVRTLTDRGMGPRSMIWAGVAYDATGRVLENLDRHRITPLDHKPPLRIIRHSERPRGTENAPAAPRRHLILGRGLRPTGTAG